MAERNPTIVQYPLERRKIVKKFIGAMIGWGILFSILTGAIMLFLPLLSWITAYLLVLYLVLALFYFWYERKYFERYYYDIRNDFLVIKKGIFAPRETTLPYEKLQDVYMDQDLLDRLFNLWDLHVSSATAMSGYAAHIEGVNIYNAETMKNMILEKIRRSKGG